MRNLTYLNSDPIDEFDLILKSKRDPAHAILTLLRPEIAARYKKYQKEFTSNSLHKLNAIFYLPSVRQILSDCYGNPTQALDRLIVKIKENQPSHLRSVCQYCGIDTDNTIDHYIPQSTHPEFSVCHLNLFPCCAVCNPIKNNYWYDYEENYPGIINLYLDVLPLTKQFLFADVKFVKKNLIVNYRLDNPQGIDSKLYKIIQNHFNRIKLLDKYDNKAGNIFQRIYNNYHGQDIFKTNPKAVRLHLLQDAKNHFVSFGRNHYEGILKEALANNNDFVDFF